jgi:hypothetical protein
LDIGKKEEIINMKCEKCQKDINPKKQLYVFGHVNLVCKDCSKNLENILTFKDLNHYKNYLKSSIRKLKNQNSWISEGKEHHELSPLKRDSILMNIDNIKEFENSLEEVCDIYE